MSALGDRGITLEGLAAAVDALRQELATWKALARKQDALSADQITATQSGATAAKISQIAVNTAAIQSLAAQVAGQIALAYVTTLPATGEPLTLYLVPQGDGTAPNYCNEYLWINNDWELIGTTGAMANNGELAIQVNGVTVGTFTANQAANAAVNITVPTNTNQLTNGAQFVDAAALQAALALKQNSLNATQLEAVNSGITAAAVQQIADNATAISGKQDALTTAQQAAVDSGATAAKIDQIASNASAIVSLTSSKQEQLSTTQLAAVNSGVTAAAVQQIGTNASNISGLQTAVSSKAADNAVVHLAGAETISGDKTHDGKLGITGNNLFAWERPQVTRGTLPSSTVYYGTTRYRDANLSSFLLCRGSINTAGDMDYGMVMYPWLLDSSKGWSFYVSADGNDVWLRPIGDNVHLGMVSHKWLSFNGINPGALGMIDTSTYVDIDSSAWNTTGAANLVQINDANPTFPGHLFIRATGTNTDYIAVRVGGSSAGFPLWTAPYYPASGGKLHMIVPCPANSPIRVYTSVAPAVCRYFACLGNV